MKMIYEEIDHASFLGTNIGMSCEMNETIAVALCTFPSVDVAESVVRQLVDDRLIACGTMLPNALSVYRWEGAIERVEEVQVFMKTQHAHVTKLQDRVTELHPYDVPEFMVLDVGAASTPYMQWVVESTTKS